MKGLLDTWCTTGVRCSGLLRRGDAIVAAMRDRYPESPDFEAEIFGFLQEMVELGGIVLPGDADEVTR